MVASSLLFFHLALARACPSLVLFASFRPVCLFIFPSRVLGASQPEKSPSYSLVLSFSALPFCITLPFPLRVPRWQFIGIDRPGRIDRQTSICPVHRARSLVFSSSAWLWESRRNLRRLSRVSSSALFQLHFFFCFLFFLSYRLIGLCVLYVPSRIIMDAMNNSDAGAGVGDGDSASTGPGPGPGTTTLPTRFLPPGWFSSLSIPGAGCLILCFLLSYLLSPLCNG